VIKRTLSSLAWVATRRRYRVARIGWGSRVDFWKLRAKSDNLLEIGERSRFATRVYYERPGAALSVGARSFIGLGLMSIAERIEIGEDVLMSWGVTIVDHQSHSTRASERRKDAELWLDGLKDWTHVKIAPVRIADRAWLGFNVSVLPGVTIGEGAVVGACSLVSRSVPPYTVAAGNPARVLRELSADER
jgi:galactoside O-acetyltransferase